MCKKLDQTIFIYLFDFLKIKLGTAKNKNKKGKN